MTTIRGLTAVVPAGGAGTRLWPLSRAGRPKFLLDLTGSGRSLLQGTWDRLTPLAGAGVVVVTGAAHADAVRAQLPDLSPSGIVVEPDARDSMPAIGLAAAIVAARDPDAVIGSFAADHVIGDEPAFDEAVAAAVVAARAGWLVTIGIQPTRAATGFGYVELGVSLGLADAPSVVRAVRFVEKPDAVTAAGYVASGAFRWNAGMFVVRADTLLALLAETRPRMADALREIGRSWDTDQRDDVLARGWPALERIAIDHAVAEPAAAAGRVACVPADLGWDDIGDWAALAGQLSKAPGPTILGDPALVLALDAGGLIVPAGGRTVTVIGLPDVVVIDTPDAVLVVPADQAQRAKEAVAAWLAAGRPDLR